MRSGASSRKRAAPTYEDGGARPLRPRADAAHCRRPRSAPRVAAESIVVDEGPATNTHVRAFHQVTRPDRYFFVRGGGLGWGMPAALGVSLGFDREPVLCIVGDGAAMYSPQALWSAAHEQLPVVFAVVNNREYNILKNYMRGMEGYNATMGKFIGMDIADPPVDFVALARSMGVAATLVQRAGDVGDAVRAAWQSGKPHLLELPMAATERG